MFTNFYECPCCGACWQDEWTCACDDECGECGARDIEPYDFIDQDEEDEEAA